MGKDETSRAHEASWSGKPLRLRTDSRSHPYDPSLTLRDPKFVRKAILQAIGEGDFEAVIEIYRAHLRVLNRSHTAAALGVSRQYVHKMLKPASNPSLKTFAAFMKVLKVRACA